MSIAEIMMSDDVYDLEITFKGTDDLHTQLTILLTQCIAKICGESNGNTYEFCISDVDDKVLSRVKKAFLKAGVCVQIVESREPFPKPQNHRPTDLDTQVTMLSRMGRKLRFCFVTHDTKCNPSMLQNKPE